MIQIKCKHTVKRLIGISIFFGLLLIIDFVFFSLPIIFLLWGGLLGIILGVISSIFLVKTYDIISGNPKDPQSFLNRGGPGLGILLGAITTSYAQHFLDKSGQFFLGGVALAWLLFIFAFVAYYRCKHESKSTKG